MLTTFDVVYYAIYIACLVLSFKAREATIPGLPFLRFMFCFGLGTEATVELLQAVRHDDTPPYYLYIPVEYYCLTQFYKRNTAAVFLVKALNISVPLYFLSALLLAIYRYRFSGYPSVVYNISCFLNIVWITLLLFNFKMGDGQEIWRQPLFVILSALLIFFAGVFFFNLVYAYLQEKDPALAKNLRTYINIVLNFILYLLLSYGFICSANKRKSL